jgi:alcohol dehydrogenase (cytochrome c)
MNFGIYYTNNFFNLQVTTCLVFLLALFLNIIFNSTFASLQNANSVSDEYFINEDYNGKNLSTSNDNNSLNAINSEIGTEEKNKDNWITINHDIYGSRYSNQTIIEKDNVNKLHIKWQLFNNAEIQDPPVIIGNIGYVQDYVNNIIAFDIKNGKILWKIQLGTGPTMGLTYSNGMVFASTGFNATVIALNATNGKILWQSPKLGNPQIGYNIPTAPIVWKKFVVVGSAAGGDEPNGVGFIQGNITAIDIDNGKVIWNLHTTTGEWVEAGKAPSYNGDASAWSGGSLDPETGLIYIPLGSPSPNFNASTRQETPNLYANHMVAVNITNGKIKWATPFIDFGTILPVTVPDTHDWDTSWGSSISKAKFDNGTVKKIVIGHDKMGNIIAMDASTGKELWWNILGKQYNTNAIPKPNGSGTIWSQGIFNFHAVDSINNTLYIAATNRGVNYFTDDGVKGHRVAPPDTIELGLRNGTIAALDLTTGKIKWQIQTEFPPRVSPLITDNIVFTGFIPFSENNKTKLNHNSLVKKGVILALDKNTGKKLWEFEIDAPISPVGPSLGQGMLFVPTGKVQGYYKDKSVTLNGGSIIAFGLTAK